MLMMSSDIYGGFALISRARATSESRLLCTVLNAESVGLSLFVWTDCFMNISLIYG